jgi:hypothetical protein
MCVTIEATPTNELENEANDLLDKIERLVRAIVTGIVAKKAQHAPKGFA